MSNNQRTSPAAGNEEHSGDGGGSFNSQDPASGNFAARDIPTTVSESELQERMVSNSKLLDVFDRQAVRLAAVLQGLVGRHALVVTDDDGCCLRLRLCELGDESLRQLGVVKGGLLREGVPGLSGVAACLERAVPSMFRGPEHEHLAYQDWLTVGVPIQAYDGGTIGVLGLFVPSEQDVPGCLDLLLLAARAVEGEIGKSALQHMLVNKTDALERMRRDWLSLCDSVPVGLALIDGKTNISIWNHAAERITGVKAGTALGKNLFNCELASDTRLHGVHQDICGALSEGVGVSGRELRLSISGEERVITYDVVPVGGTAQRKRCVVAFQDVTCQRRLEGRVEVVNEQVTLVGRALDALPYGLSVSDSFGRLVYVNQEFLGMFNCQARDVLGQTLPELDLDVRVPGEEWASGTGTKGSLLCLEKEGRAPRFFIRQLFSVIQSEHEIGSIMLCDQCGPKGNLSLAIRVLPDSFPITVAEAAKEGLRAAVLWDKVRRMYGLTPARFAGQVLGINLSQYLRYEKGEKFPSLPNALALAGKVGCPVETIYQLLLD